MSAKLEFKQIGVIRTPYIDNAPYQPVDEDKGEFYIALDGKYAEGLVDLAGGYLHEFFNVHVQRAPLAGRVEFI